MFSYGFRKMQKNRSEKSVSRQEFYFYCILTLVYIINRKCIFLSSLTFFKLNYKIFCSQFYIATVTKKKKKILKYTYQNDFRVD